MSRINFIGLAVQAVYMNGEEGMVAGFARMYEEASLQLLVGFAVPTAIVSAIWTGVIDVIIFDPAMAAGPSEAYGIADRLPRVSYTLVICIVSVVPAVANYSIAPREPVDVYHRIGILFAMYIPINLFLSAGFLLGPIFVNEWYVAGAGSGIQYSLVTFVVSSLFLPGPYLGVYLSTWVDTRYSLLS